MGLVLELAAVLGVLTLYGEIACGWREPHPIPPLADSWKSGYYSALAEGFRLGRLDLPVEPPPALARLADPYSKDARAGIACLWDASYFEGKYFLYHSPLPVLLLYLPVRWITGSYPTDPCAAAAFFGVAFLLLWAFARRVLAAVPGGPMLPRWLWALQIGLGGVTCFTLVHVRVYEVCIACGMACSALWAYALLHHLTCGGGTRSALACGIAASLALAARPHLALLVPISIAAISGASAGRMRLREMAALCAPVLAIVALLALYNVERFHRPLEFGTTYQLSYVRTSRTFDVTDVEGLARFADNLAQYVLWAPIFSGKFPYVRLRGNDLGAVPHFPGGPEEVGGALALAPHGVIGIGLVVLLMGGALRAQRPAPELVASLYTTVAAVTVCLALCGFWWNTARYENDFLGLFSAGIFGLVEIGGASLLPAGRGRAAFALVLATALIYGALTGAMLGATGYSDAIPLGIP